MLEGAIEQRVGVEILGERLGPLRLCELDAVTSMRRSLEHHGQLSPVAVFAGASGVEVVDGFKRLRAARALGWQTIRAHTLDIDIVGAKIAIAFLHASSGLTELEEAWLVRSLYRDDRLSQPEIAVRLGRHKSWVSRRLLLAEGLDEAVQADVRLGLLAPRAAAELARLPRGNQQATAQLVMRTGLTTRQTEQLIRELCACDSDEARERLLRERLERPAEACRRRDPTRPTRTPAEWLLADVATMRRVAGRLQGRLLSQPLAALGPRVAEVAAHTLMDLVPVLEALRGSIQSVASTGGVV